MSRMIRKGWVDTMTDDQRAVTLVQTGGQRWKDFGPAVRCYLPGFPREPAASGSGRIWILLPVSSLNIMQWNVASIPNPGAAFTVTSGMSFMNFPLMNYIETISPRPLLFIIGEHAHSRYFTEDAYKRAAEPKELYIVPGARHIDLYDGGDNNYIPFDELESFFKKNLNK